MQPFQDQDIPQFRRREFLRISAGVGLSLIMPAFISCERNLSTDVGDVVPNIALDSMTKEEVVIPSDFRGKALILHFWANWCPSCRKEMTDLEAVFRKYNGKGVMPCSIGIGEKRETAFSYMKDIEISYPVLFDPDSLTRRIFGISGIPTYYLLDRSGITRRKILGDIGKNGWDDLIKTVM
jgi:cytochrome c biogenesis protein CcmG, thiol:disulfide interchange protein DsbE